MGVLGISVEFVGELRRAERGGFEVVLVFRNAVLIGGGGNFLLKIFLQGYLMFLLIILNR